MNFGLANLHHPRANVRIRAKRYLSVHSDLLAEVVAMRIDRLKDKRALHVEASERFRRLGE
jgi:hypothetical protein